MMKKALQRCSWPGEIEIMRTYHDTEWGVPAYDDPTHYEFLVLEAAQAGLSWLTILKRREGYRKAFANFDVEKVARFSEKKIERLLLDPGIIRNRLKVEAAVHNAKLFIGLQEEFGSFSNYCWRFVDGKPLLNKWKTSKQIPATSKQSDAWAKDLKKRGFKFVGSTVLYAHMQAAGMVNDHLMDCYRYKEIKRLY